MYQFRWAFFLKSYRSSCSSPKSQFKLYLPHVTANISHLKSLLRIREPQHLWSPVLSCSLANSKFTSCPAAERLWWWSKGRRGGKKVWERVQDDEDDDEEDCRAVQAHLQAKKAEQNLPVQLQVLIGTFDITNELFIEVFIESKFCQNQNCLWNHVV